MSKAKTLRDMLVSEEVILAPCAFDALSAKMIEKSGFKLVATTGSGMHGAMLGVPDSGLLAFNEMADALGKMCDAVSIPVIADAEGGYGNAINTMRTVRTFEKMGLSGLFIEDQRLPPNCPFMKQPPIISVDEMVGKIKAAVDARQDPNFVIIARSDAPFEEAVERLNIYAEAGADMVKAVPKSNEEFLALPKRVKAPLHFGFTSGKGIHDGMNAWDIGKLGGYKIITFPMAPLGAIVYAGMSALEVIRDKGSDEEFFRAYSMNEYFDFIGFKNLRELEGKYLRG